MKSKNISHSKFKNTGILFELLVRQIASDAVAKKENAPALRIVKEFFNPSTEMGKELQLYRSFFDMQKLNENKALQFIELVVKQRVKLDERKLAIEKYNLVKAIKENYDLAALMTTKIPSYKIYAAIYKTFLAENHQNFTNISDVAQSRFTLIEHLISPTAPKKLTESKLIEEFKSQTEDLRLLTYKTLMEKFNEKYEGLSDKQKTLLREYINNISNAGSFRAYLSKEIPLLTEQLQAKSAKLTNKVLQIKLQEVASQVASINSEKKVKDSDLTSLMIAYQIVDEL